VVADATTGRSARVMEPLPTPYLRFFVSTGPTISANTYTVMTGRFN
jgi:hypothetical protein